MRTALAFALLSTLLLVACDSESSHRVEYVADGNITKSIDVALVLPRGIVPADDSLFVMGDSVYVSGDTTYVLNVAPPWHYAFDADEGQTLFLRTHNRQDRKYVTSIIYVDDKFFKSSTDITPFGAAVSKGTL